MIGLKMIIRTLVEIGENFMSFDYVIKELKDHKKKIMKELAGQSDLSTKKLELNRAIKALELLNQNDFEDIKVYKIPSLVDFSLYPEYSLRVEQEGDTEGTAFTDEVFYAGDLIISKRNS